MKIAPPIHANPGVAADYRRALAKLIAQMTRSYEYWLIARWKDNPPTMAMDNVGSVNDLIKTMNGLGRRWEDRFDMMALELARRFGDSVNRSATARMSTILKDYGFTVKFHATRYVRQQLKAAVTENVGLIKSIQQDYHRSIEGAVMRAVKTGGDLQQLTSFLKTQMDDAGKKSQERAVFIAHDQNRKSVAAVTQARQQEAGITQAVWMHSGAGKHPRIEHVQFAAGRYRGPGGPGPIYNVDTGVDFQDGFGPVRPGVAINCRCASRPIIPEFGAAATQVRPMKPEIYEKAIARAK